MKKRRLSLMIASAAVAILMVSGTVFAAEAEPDKEPVAVEEEDKAVAEKELTETEDKAATDTELTTKDEKALEIELPIATDEAALQIALDHCGYTKEEAEEVKIEKDTEDGKETYDVEFYVGVSKFDYDIDAATGKIIEYEVDD